MLRLRGPAHVHMRGKPPAAKTGGPAVRSGRAPGSDGGPLPGEPPTQHEALRERQEATRSAWLRLHNSGAPMMDVNGAFRAFEAADLALALYTQKFTHHPRG